SSGPASAGAAINIIITTTAVAASVIFNTTSIFIIDSAIGAPRDRLAEARSFHHARGRELYRAYPLPRVRECREPVRSVPWPGNPRAVWHSLRSVRPNVPQLVDRHRRFGAPLRSGH